MSRAEGPPTRLLRKPARRKVGEQDCDGSYCMRFSPDVRKHRLCDPRRLRFGWLTNGSRHPR